MKIRHLRIDWSMWTWEYGEMTYRTNSFGQGIYSVNENNMEIASHSEFSTHLVNIENKERVRIHINRYFARNF